MDKVKNRGSTKKLILRVRISDKIKLLIFVSLENTHSRGIKLTTVQFINCGLRL